MSVSGTYEQKRFVGFTVLKAESANSASSTEDPSAASLLDNTTTSTGARMIRTNYPVTLGNARDW